MEAPAPTDNLPQATPDPVSPAMATYEYNGSSDLGAPIQQGDVISSALAIYTVQVDPGSLSATATLKQVRQGAANDDLYLLPIDSFLTPTSFSITGISGDATNLNLDYSFAHPFPACLDPAGTPNGSTNRADLGVAASLLFLTDVTAASGNTYFTDRVANTGVVTNADSFYAPGALVDTTGMLANTFPMQMVIDEEADNRAGVSNSGNVAGNYGPDGWTRTELGATHDQWSGYGVLHQGQVARGTLSLDRAIVGVEGFNLDVAVLAKYNDPRGGTTPAAKKANRLPPATPDTSLFAYRMPHGAWDVSGIDFVSQVGDFVDTQVSAATLNFHVVDWDARATESTQPVLSDDLDPTLVAIGEAGPPDFAVSIPGVLGDETVIDDWDPSSDVIDDDTAVGGDAGADSGQEGDPLFFTKSVTENLISGQTPGTYTGLARATDVEVANITDPLFVVELDGNLTPLAANIPAPIAYQAFTVTVISTNALPTASFSTGAVVLSGTATTHDVTVDAANDGDGETISVEIDWDGGSDTFVLAGTIPAPYTVPVNFTSPAGIWVNATATAIVRTINVRFSDGVVPSPINAPDLTTSLGGNRSPIITGGTVGLANASLSDPATFALSAGGLTFSDPEGDTVSFTVRSDVNNNGSFEQIASSIGTLAGYNATPVMGPFGIPDSQVRFEAYINDTLHAGIAGTAVPSTPSPLLGTISAGLTGWVWTMTASTASIEDVFSTTVDPSGDVYGTGVWTTTAPGCDFGGGVRTPGTGQNMYLVKLNGTTGLHVWDRVWTASSGRPISTDTDSAGNVYVYMTFGGTLTIAGLGGGAADQISGGASDIAILKFSPAGTFLGLARSNEVTDTGVEGSPSATFAGSGLGTASRGMAIDKSNNAVFIGNSPSGVGTVTIGGLPVTTTGVRDAIVARFDGPAFVVAGTTPAIWAQNLAPTAGATTNQRVSGLAVAGAGGNVVISGQYDNVALTDFGGGGVAAVGLNDVFIVQRNPTTGAYVAGSQRVFGTAGTDGAHGIAANSGHILVSGVFSNGIGQTMTIGAPASVMTSGGASNGWVGCFTTANVPVWNLAHTGAGNIHANGGVALSGSDVFVYSTFTSAAPGADFGYGNKIPLSSSDWSYSRYGLTTGATTGWQQVWAGNNGSSFDAAYGTAISGSNPVFAGRMQNGGTCDFNPGPGTATRTMLGSDIVIVKLNGSTGEF